MQFAAPPILHRDVAAELCRFPSYELLDHRIGMLDGTRDYGGTYWRVHWSLWRWAGAVWFQHPDAQKKFEHALWQARKLPDIEFSFQLHNLGVELQLGAEFLADEGIEDDRIRLLSETAALSLTEAVGRKRKLDDKHWLLSSLSMLARVYAFLRQTTQAKAVLEEGLRLAAELGDNDTAKEMRTSLLGWQAQLDDRPWWTMSPIDILGNNDGTLQMQNLFGYLPIAFAHCDALLGPLKIDINSQGVDIEASLTIRSSSGELPWQRDAWKQNDPGLRLWNKDLAPGFILAVPHDLIPVECEVTGKVGGVEREYYRQMLHYLGMPESYPLTGVLPLPLGATHQVYSGHFVFVCWRIMFGESYKIRLRLTQQKPLAAFVPKNALFPQATTAQRTEFGVLLPYPRTTIRSLLVSAPQDSEGSAILNSVRYGSGRIWPAPLPYEVYGAATPVEITDKAVDLLQGGQLVNTDYRVVAISVQAQPSPAGLLPVLYQFKASVEQGSLEALWEKRSQGRWRSRPETIAQGLLQSFLHDRSFHGTVLEPYEQVKAGVGRIDLLVLHGEDRYIVELKMLGGVYGKKDLESGFTQLDYYMARHEAHSAYLVVFDASRGKIPVPETYWVAQGEVKVLRVDVNPVPPSKA